MWVEATEKTRQVGLAHFGRVFTDSLRVLEQFDARDIDAALTIVRALTKVMSQPADRPELRPG